MNIGEEQPPIELPLPAVPDETVPDEAVPEEPPVPAEPEKVPT